MEGSQRSGAELFLHEQDFLGVVDFGEFDLDDFVHGGLHEAADEGGFNRQLTVAAVDQHAQLNPAGTPVGEKGIECCADGPAREQYVVHQDDVLAFNIQPDLRFLDHGAGAERGKVIAVEGNVQSAHANGRFLDSLDELAQALRDWYAAAPDSDQAQTLGTIIFLNNLVGETNQGALDFRGGHELRLLAQRGLRSRTFSSHDRVHHTRPDRCG